MNNSVCVRVCIGVSVCACFSARVWAGVRGWEAGDERERAR